MPRIEIELTSARPDGTWTWRAAGAKQPKGTLDASVLPGGAKVGDVLRAEADIDIDGITVRSTVPSTPEEGRRAERIEIIGSGREEPPVTTNMRGGVEAGGERGRRGDRDARSGRPADRAGRSRRSGGGGGPGGPGGRRSGWAGGRRRRSTGATGRLEAAGRPGAAAVPAATGPAATGRRRRPSRRRGYRRATVRRATGPRRPPAATGR